MLQTEARQLALNLQLITLTTEIQSMKTLEIGLNKSKVFLSDGSEYTGEWLNEEPDGQGVKIFHNSSTSDAKPSSIKTKYEGHFKRGRAHGFGKCSYYNGSTYEGMWENDEKHGLGKQISKKGNILTGKWVNGTLEGKGKEVCPNGDVYEGDFSMGKKHGSGEFKFNDGSCYSGEFKENSINGYGKYTWNDGR
jgi:hypothetical protein